MPAQEHDSQLHAVLSYYNSVVSVTPEGDSLVSDETLEGLGTDESSSSLFYSLFGSLVRVASPLPPIIQPEPPISTTPKYTPEISIDIRTDDTDAVPTASSSGMSTATVGGDEDGSVADTEAMRRRLVADGYTQAVGDGTADEHSELSQPSAGVVTAKKKLKLTDFSPDPGYFLAGAIAGGVSRTATAPLDRLKVYLLVNTSSGSETAATAIKQGRPIVAVQNAFRPITDAVKDLFRNGGLRSFFAGECSHVALRGMRRRNTDEH